MNLLALRTEVLNHGFDPILFSSRITQYLNDAQALIARRVDYYVDEATDPFATVVGTTLIPFPADFARARSLFNVDTHIELIYVGLRDIDRSTGSLQAMPRFYAIDGANIHLYPAPDNVYNLELRYWKMPATLVNDTDTPTLPVDWHHILWCYATWMCYEAEDDPQMGDYWQKRFNTELAMFTADQKFPDTDGPVQARGMWDGPGSVKTPGSWLLYD